MAVPPKTVSNEHIDPNQVNGNTEYAGNIAPERADQSTVGGAPGAYYAGDTAHGNVVDRERIPKTMDNVSRDSTRTSPAGPLDGATPNGRSY